jgi:hypothetical protein
MAELNPLQERQASEGALALARETDPLQPEV